MPPVDAPATLVLVCVGSLVLVHVAFRSLERRRRMIGIPTSAAASVHIGLNRVHGQARPVAEALVAPITGIECAGWSYHVEDEWRIDSMMRWRRRRRWRTVAQRSDEADFDLVDASGSVRVRPAGAVIVGCRTLSRSLDRSDPDFVTLPPPADQRGATGRRRVTELVIPLTAPTTVVGTARLRADVPRPELGWHHEDRTLLVSSIGVAVHAGRNIVSAVGLFLAAAFLLGIAPLAIRPSDTKYTTAISESGRWVPVLLVGALLVVAGYWLRYLHNDLVGLRERVERARSLIAVEVQRRHDLLPALAEVVADAARHEQDLFAAAATARSAADPGSGTDDLATVERVEREDTAIVRQVVALAERHPELASGANFQQVREAIVDAEDRLALARSFYNDSVTLYNDRRALAPASLVAGLLGFRPAGLYQSATPSASSTMMGSVPMGDRES